MNQLISISLLILLTWQFVFKAGFVVYWKINQRYIAATLCENKDKPEMHCDGKCYLKEHLSKAEEKENASIPGQILKLKSFDNFIIRCHFENCSSFFDFYKPKPSSFYSFKASTEYRNSLFKPPEFI